LCLWSVFLQVGNLQWADEELNRAEAVLADIANGRKQALKNAASHSTPFLAKVNAPGERFKKYDSPLHFVMANREDLRLYGDDYFTAIQWETEAGMKRAISDARYEGRSSCFFNSAGEPLVLLK
jgi:hypothetical protein